MNPVIQEYAALAGRIALFPFTHVCYHIFYAFWLAINYTLVVPSTLAFQSAKVYLPVDLDAMDYQEQAVFAGKLALRVVLFPFTHVLFYIVLSVWLVVKHTIVVPLLLMLRITLFGLVYLPLTPVLTAADVDYDQTVSVESLLLQLVFHSIPHAAFFALHLLHYVIIAAVTGVIVGWFTGLNISVVSKVLTPPPLEEAIQEELERTKAKMEELKAQLPNLEAPVLPKVEALVKAEPPKLPVKVKEEPRELSVSDLVQNEPKRVQRGKIDFSEGGAEHSYEDDDGYNFMRYLRDSPEPRVATIKEEPEEPEEAETGENSEELSSEQALTKSQKKRRLRKRREASRRLGLALTPGTVETAAFSEAGEGGDELSRTETAEPETEETNEK